MGLFSPNKKRGTEALGDMVRSLAVVLVVILVVGVYFLFGRSHGDAIRVVDSGPQLRAARTTAGYHVVAPVGLGPGWRLTSARDDVRKLSVGLHLGYVTPQGHYAAVDEAGSPKSASHEKTLNQVMLPPKGTQRLRPVTIDGEQWQRWREGRDTDLNRITPTGAWVSVHGDAPLDELIELVTSLR